MRTSSMFFNRFGAGLPIAAVLLLLAGCGSKGGDKTDGQSGMPNPDNVSTSAGNLSIMPIHHGSIGFVWGGKRYYSDPVGPATRYADPATAPALGFIVITHPHGDHLDTERLKALRGGTEADKAPIIAPPSVAKQIREAGFAKDAVTELQNGENTEIAGVQIQAVAMYNLKKPFHKKGEWNGYVLTFGDKRVYISGDTEDIPEMRALKNIDVAFVCMNLPYTMTAESAASAVLEFRPKVVYPYHFRGKGPDGTQDPAKFAKIVSEKNTAIEVRLREWYRE